jgi:antitoxin MazE
MKAQIIQIGNSQGVRIPKVMLEEARLAGEVELEIRKEGLLLRRAQTPRSDWNERFKGAAEHDEPEEPFRPPSEYDRSGWQW